MSADIAPRLRLALARIVIDHPQPALHWIAEPVAA